jgi:predicted unusual protein kinase regulating ubiquinone biosynthesis (AarF/ABC1/UbiB family)
MARPPKGTRRALRLASMTASVAGGFARNRVASLFRRGDQKEDAQEAFLRDAGLLVASTLGDLKGAAMKVGQMASTAADLLPPEVAEALATLQKQAPPMEWEVISEQVEAELGQPPELLFARFDHEAFAAASIGQVHRAATDDGREVVVKVQYPGVGDAVDSDLAAVRRAMRLGRLATDKEALDATFDELRDRLEEELDYCNESENLRRFAARHDEDWLVIPSVVAERSSGRILTLTYEPGEDLLEAKTWPQADRDRLGARLVSILLRQLFEFGEVHGDWHPGNFGFRRDGTIVLYDWGCVRAYAPAIQVALRDVALSARDRDATLADDAWIRIGVRRPDRPSPGPEVYGPLLAFLGEPLRARPYDFGADRLTEEMMELAPSLVRHATAFRPGPEIAIIKRVVAGLMDLLKALGARVDVAGLLETWTEA